MVELERRERDVRANMNNDIIKMITILSMQCSSSFSALSDQEKLLQEENFSSPLTSKVKRQKFVIKGFDIFSH